MSEDERKLSAYSIILKISAISGWTIPVSDQILDILVDQFEKKLNESYRNVNPQEVEYAFRNRGIDIKDWGKALNLTLIDEVMIPYLETRFELSKLEESLKTRTSNQIEDKKELTDYEWQEWLKDIRNYKFEMIPCIAYDYLVRKELINLSVKVKHEYMHRAVSYLISTTNPLSKEMSEILSMRKEGIYSAEITSLLINFSKKFAISDYLKNN